MFSPKIKRLIDTLQQLPSIGPKSAQRLVFHLLSEKGRQTGINIAVALEAAMSDINTCNRCRNYTEDPICHLCDSNNRNAQILCVLESPVDVCAIEQTGAYQGLYFVLQGHLSPLDNIGPNDIGLPLLFKRLQDEDIKEVIIATNPTIEGEATAHYIVQHAPAKIKCTRIAYGVPIGGELEYLDHHTLRHALTARMAIVEQHVGGK
jgi:recombination protein RecR